MFAVDDVPDVSGANTLPEAKMLLKLLFRMLVDMKRTDRANVGSHTRCVHLLRSYLWCNLQTAARDELEFRVQELEGQVESGKNAMVAMQLDFERRKTELESEHDKQTSWLVRLHCTFVC
jgi:hypothetical protein